MSRSLRYNPRPSSAIQVAISSADAPAEKRLPSTHVPVLPASSARRCLLPPMDEEPDVQNGTTVLPVKSLPAAKPSIAHEGFPHQMGKPKKTVV